MSTHKHTLTVALLRMTAALLLSLGMSMPAWSVPINDLLGNAIALTPTGGTVIGTTVDATTDAGAPLAGTSITSPGVWYSFYGSGGLTSFDTNSPSTNFDTKLSIYSGPFTSLAGLNPVGGNDDSFDCGLAATVWCSAFSFNSTAGTSYRLLVHGFGGATGSFGVNYSGIGERPTGSVPEPAALGLLGLGLAGLGLSRRRQTRAA